MMDAYLPVLPSNKGRAFSEGVRFIVKLGKESGFEMTWMGKFTVTSESITRMNKKVDVLAKE